MLNHGVCRYLIPRFRKVITWGFMVGSGTVILKWLQKTHNFDKQKWDPKVLRWGIKGLVHPVRCRLVRDVAGKQRNVFFFAKKIEQHSRSGHTNSSDLVPNSTKFHNARCKNLKNMSCLSSFASEILSGALHYLKTPVGSTHGQGFSNLFTTYLRDVGG